MIGETETLDDITSEIRSSDHGGSRGCLYSVKKQLVAPTMLLRLLNCRGDPVTKAPYRWGIYSVTAEDLAIRIERARKVDICRLSNLLLLVRHRLVCISNLLKSPAPFSANALAEQFVDAAAATDDSLKQINKMLAALK